MTRVFLGNFTRNDSRACDNLTDNILDQYETLQYAVIYLLRTSENRLKVHKMTVNKKRH